MSGTGVMPVASQYTSPAGERVKELHLWTDPVEGVLEGVYMITSRPQTGRLNGAGNRSLSRTTLSVKGDDLATGVLLGVTAAMKPGSEQLAAISFEFLRVPVSSAIAVDMPSIAIEELVFKPQVSIQSSTRCGSVIGRLAAWH